MNFGLEKKVALVSGGTAGIGLATVKSLLAEGAQVAFFSSSSEKVQVAHDVLKKSFDPSHFYGFTADLSQVEKLDEYVNSIRKRFGPVSIFVGSNGGPALSSAEDISSKDFKRGVEINLYSMIALSQLVIPEMKENAFGRIVYVTTSGVVQPLSNLAISNTLRAGLTAFAKTLSIDVAHFGVTVNCVMPGKISTERLENNLSAKAKAAGVSLEAQKELEKGSIPAGRFGEPSEIADLITFLCSSRASYVTGANIACDGGLIKAIR